MARIIAEQGVDMKEAFSITSEQARVPLWISEDSIEELL
jgi:hypothetical protein